MYELVLEYARGDFTAQSSSKQHKRGLVSHVINQHARCKMRFGLQVLAQLTSTAVSLRTAARTAAVVGGGPAGALTAVMLARRGWQVEVIDALPSPPAADDPSWGAGERSYQLGLNGRGQRSLRQFGCMQRVGRFAASVNGRLSFAQVGSARGKPGRDAEAIPGTAFTETRFKPPGTPGAEKTYVTRVLQRDRLQACLLEELAAGYAAQVRVSHGLSCVGLDLTGERPVVEALPCTPRSSEAEECEVDEAAQCRRRAYDLVVGADGVRSTVRKAVCSKSGATALRFADSNERRYKTIPFHPTAVEGTAADLNWGYQNKSLGLGMDALPTMEGEMVGVLLFKPLCNHICNHIWWACCSSSLSVTTSVTTSGRRAALQASLCNHICNHIWSACCSSSLSL
jgi:hypothetical protein